MSNLRDGGSYGRDPRFRGRPTGRRGKSSGRGMAIPVNPGFSAVGQGEATNLRPTHFLALPLIGHPSLMADIKNFQSGLFSDADGLNDSGSTSAPGRGKGSKIATSSLVEGLDSSVLVDPRRLHMTLGVMALEEEDGTIGIPTPTHIQLPSSSSTAPPANYSHITHSQPLSLTAPTPPDYPPKKTVSTALNLLNSLKPRISEILNRDRGVKIPLDVMHVLKTEKLRTNTKGKEGRSGVRMEGASGSQPNEDNEAIGAGVLYVGPEVQNQNVNKDLRKLIQVSEFVHRAFQDAGYITDARPLKLHCTILNTSYRKPRSRQPFSYSDILVSDALRTLRGKNSRAEEGSSTILVPKHKLQQTTVLERDSRSTLTQPTSVLQPNISSSSNPNPKPSNPPITSQNQPVAKNAPPVSVNLGVFVVEEIQLWVMGSRGPNNEYISCGGVVL